jgi:CO dehydrogenase maturation factor
MRVAFVGKGGAGKSVLSATLARVLARRGRRVLALDVDTVPGLAHSLGLPLRDEGLPADLGGREEGRGWVVREGVRAEDLVAQYGIPAPDGVVFLQLGKLPDRVAPGSTTAFRFVLEEFRSAGWSLVGDLAGGTRQPFFGWGDFAQVVLVVVEPSVKSILSARRLARLATTVEGARFGIVVNKLRDADDLRLVREGVDLEVLATIPYDEQVAAAERVGRPLLDTAPTAPAVVATEGLATALEGLLRDSVGSGCAEGGARR